MNDTTTAIVERQERSPVAQQHTGVTISAMQLQTMDDAFRLARAIAQSGMTPKAYGGDENKVFVGILAGAEVGLAPMQALQSIAVINGNPAIWGDGALALVQASGLLEDIEETDDGETATCRLVRKGRPTAIIRKFSNDDAKKAGLLGKAGPWSQYQARMRQMRARSWALRDGFADVLKGLHIAEEVRDHPEMAADKPQTQRISSQMLAEQAGATIDQVEEAAVQEQEPEQTETEETADATATGSDLSEEAARTIADIDGPLEQDDAQGEVDTDEPDPIEAKANEIIAAIDKCKNIIDLRAHRERSDAHIQAMPEELAVRVKLQFKTMAEALKRKDPA